VLYAFVSGITNSTAAAKVYFAVVKIYFFHTVSCFNGSFDELVAKRVRISAFTETGRQN